MNCPYCKSENHPDATRCAACSSWIAVPVPVREWTRARNGRQIAGVCRGLADRFGFPLTVARLLFIASLFFGGWGLLLYLALWIVMPLEPEAQAAAARCRAADAAAPAGSPLETTSVVLSRAELR